MSANQLHQVALESGRFPTVTARRLRNIVVECFAPRYLVAGGAPAAHLKRLSATISTADLTQLMLVFTSRANPILGDFVRQVYWARYAGGYTQITNDDARMFVERAIDDGKTTNAGQKRRCERIRLPDRLLCRLRDARTRPAFESPHPAVPDLSSGGGISSLRAALFRRRRQRPAYTRRLAAVWPGARRRAGRDQTAFAEGACSSSRRLAM
jgi:hypothetical protein